jgi:hypothetical protein
MRPLSPDHTEPGWGGSPLLSSSPSHEKKSKQNIGQKTEKHRKQQSGMKIPKRRRGEQFKSK